MTKDCAHAYRGTALNYRRAGYGMKSQIDRAVLVSMPYSYWVTDTGVEFIKRYATGADVA